MQTAAGNRMRPGKLLLTACLVVAGVILGLWIRSLWRRDQIIWPDGPSRVHAVGLERGYVYYIDLTGFSATEEGVKRLEFRSGAGSSRSAFYADFLPPVRFHVYITTQYLDAALDTFSGGEMSGVAIWVLMVPPLVPVVAALILLILRHQRAQRRRQTGRCISCGYDVRFSGMTCSECGMPVQTALLPRRRRAVLRASAAFAGSAACTLALFRLLQIDAGLVSSTTGFRVDEPVSNEITIIPESADPDEPNPTTQPQTGPR